jgi:hypothetical protein
LEYIEGPLLLLLLLLLLLWARVMTAGVYPVEYWMAPLSFHDDSLLLYKVSVLIFLSLFSFLPSILPFACIKEEETMEIIIIISKA